MLNDDSELTGNSAPIDYPTNLGVLISKFHFPIYLFASWHLRMRHRGLTYSFGFQDGQTRLSTHYEGLTAAECYTRRVTIECSDDKVLTKKYGRSYLLMRLSGTLLSTLPLPRPTQAPPPWPTVLSSELLRDPKAHQLLIDVIQDGTWDVYKTSGMEFSHRYWAGDSSIALAYCLAEQTQIEVAAIGLTEDEFIQTMNSVLPAHVDNDSLIDRLQHDIDEASQETH